MYKTFCFLLERALTILTVELHHQLLREGVDLSHSQIVIIYALSKEEGISACRMAQYLNKDRAAVKRTVDSLVKKGYVKREKKDRKEYRVLLTDEGRAILPLLKIGVDKTKEKYFNGIDPEEIQKTIGLFNHIYEISCEEKNTSPSNCFADR